MDSLSATAARALEKRGARLRPLTHLDIIDGGMVREAARLNSSWLRQTAFELARDRHFPFLHLISSWRSTRVVAGPVWQVSLAPL